MSRNFCKSGGEERKLSLEIKRQRQSVGQSGCLLAPNLLAQGREGAIMQPRKVMLLSFCLWVPEGGGVAVGHGLVAGLLCKVQFPRPF